MSLTCLCVLVWLSGAAGELRVAAPAPPVVAPEIVRLRDGTLVHGTITDFDEPTGFVLQRADTGGLLRLRWEHLPAAEASRIKASRGFTGDAPAPYLVNVVHLVLANGTTESGVLVETGDDQAFTLRRRGGTDSFRRSAVRSVESGIMEGLEIYQPDELYRLIQDQVGAGDDALSQFNLAVACEGAGLYEQAVVHYRAVAQADAAFKPDLVATRLQRLTVKLEDAAETAELDQIRARLLREQFAQAFEMVDEFRARYPQSRQLGDLTELEGEIHRRKREYTARQIVSDYFSLLEKRVAGLSRDTQLTLDVARESLERLLHPAVLETLAGSYALTPETLDELWAARSGGSVRSYSYGTGTFILGKEKALEFGRFGRDGQLVDDAAPDAGGAPADDDFADMVERVKKQRAQKAADTAASARAGGVLAEEGQSPDEWWAATPSEERFKWLMAYYAEFSGAVMVIEARGRPCRLCDGLGYLEGINEDQEVVRVTCTTCKGLEYERLVRFR